MAVAASVMSGIVNGLMPLSCVHGAQVLDRQRIVKAAIRSMVAIMVNPLSGLQAWPSMLHLLLPFRRHCQRHEPRGQRQRDACWALQSSLIKHDPIPALQASSERGLGLA